MVSKAWVASLFLATASARAIDAVIYDRQLESKAVLLTGNQLQGLEAKLTASLPLKKWSSKTWAAGYVPESCKGVHVGEGANVKTIDPTQFEVYEVTYEDCTQPFVICRHKKADIQKAELVDAISRLPVRMRQHIANYIAVPPETHPGWAAWAYGHIMVSQTGAGWKAIGMLSHEITHVLDNYAVSPKPGYERFSMGPEFKKAADRDPKTATTYGRNEGYIEEFAEIGRLSIYNRNVQGGLHAAGIDFTGIKNQIALYEWRVGDRNVKGGLCTKEKVASSKAVRVGSSFVGGPVPETSGTGSTPPVIDGEIYHSHA